MKKHLKLFNGRWGNSNNQHIYIAAYSVNDAAGICAQLSGNTRGWTYEINQYFSKGCWGRPMTEIIPERGAWIQKTYNGKPIKQKIIN